MTNISPNHAESSEFPPGTIPLRSSEFRFIRELVHERLGISLTEQKHTLVVGRLQGLLKEKDFTSFRQYCDYLTADQSGKALVELAERISTNHSFFYRESSHFEFLRTCVLPDMVAKKKASGTRDLRIWSAGCAAGEEPYTLVMVLMDFFGDEYAAWDAGVLATDISSQALASAGTATYAEQRLRDLPVRFRQRYLRAEEPDVWTVVECVRKEVTFRRFNLMNSTFPFRQPFDIIFCRNVMIYFDVPTREGLTRRFYDNIVPGGYLFTGLSESLPRNSCPFDPIQPAVYRRPD